MDLKSILKLLKLNESTVSTFLGIALVVIAGIVVLNFLRKPATNGTVPTGSVTETENENFPPTETSAGKHKVAKGETLWNIAETYYKSGYNWVDIARENKLANADNLTEGQELIIPSVKPRVETLSKVPQVAASDISESANTIKGNSYTVVKGDNLWNIAIRAYGDGYQWVKISRENKLVNPNLIHSGNILVIPR